MQENNFENVPAVNSETQRTLGQGFAELSTNIGTGLGGFLQGVVGGATKPLQSTTTTVKEQTTAGTPAGTNTDKNKNTIFIVVGIAIVGLLAVLLLVGKKGG